MLQALSGYLTLSARLLTSDDPVYQSGWNIGPMAGNELPVQDIVRTFLREWGGGSWVDVSGANDPHEANILRLAIDKAIWQLDWRPGWDVQETVKQTVLWYRAYYEESLRMRDISLQQIEQYEAAIGWSPTSSATLGTVVS